jgi:hypothetical protein
MYNQGLKQMCGIVADSPIGECRVGECRVRDEAEEAETGLKGTLWHMYCTAV